MGPLHKEYPDWPDKCLSLNSEFIRTTWLHPCWAVCIVFAVSYDAGFYLLLCSVLIWWGLSLLIHGLARSTASEPLDAPHTPSWFDSCCPFHCCDHVIALACKLGIAVESIPHEDDSKQQDHWPIASAGYQQREQSQPAQILKSKTDRGTGIKIADAAPISKHSSM